jgi:DNA-binding MarR family transcriptional regulator
VDCHSRREQLDAEIQEGFRELIGRVIAISENLAQGLCVPGFFVKALYTLDKPMAMKDLGKRMHCDPSFVTVIADMLEKRGLATREPHPGDRRVKNLVLNDEGLQLKQRVESELAARMPWSTTLTPEEREQLLRLIRKMIGAHSPASATGADTLVSTVIAGPGPTASPGEVDDALGAASAPVG